MARKTPARSSPRPRNTAAPQDPSRPKTTRPAATQRRAPQRPVTAGRRIQRTFDAMPDRIDIRDWYYQPRLAPLPDQLINCDSVPADGILDQGQEGACTGFALAAVINYLLASRNVRRRVSPRMLYELARRYDEWPGENYEGSSARGAMKGWVAHGVCPESAWKKTQKGIQHFTPDIVKLARATPGGAFYRVQHREVRDMHAALNEVGILYMTLMVHEGWGDPAPMDAPLTYVEHGNLRSRKMALIRRKGRSDDGHAVAIVGYTRDGFIIQNSWGPDWGADGFALLPYEDYLLHATDVWVAQVGVPLEMDLWSTADAADTSAGIARAVEAVPLADIRPYVIDVGNDGRLSDAGQYWTTRDDVTRLFNETIRDKTADWSKRRILLYLHGGLNDEKAVARRVVAFRDVMLANEIYPIHIMWETGATETIKQIIADYLGIGRAGGVADWLEKTRQGLIEAKDRTFELTVAGPGTALWSQMKQNAERAWDARKDNIRDVVLSAVRNAIAGLPASERTKWELHVVGHSAGSIFAAHAMSHLLSLGIPLKTFQLMAPAITIDEFERLLLPRIDSGACPHPTMYLLSDAGERDDTVGPYGKSLLYLVSNSFEGRRETPLLGMERFVTGDKASARIKQLFSKKVQGWPSLVVAGAGPQDAAGKEAVSPSLSRSSSHGGFDNDEWTMNSLLYRILGDAPPRPFTLRDLQY